MCESTFPWNAKDVKQRIGHLISAVDALKRTYKSMTAEEYEKATAELAGKMSETRERILSLEIADQLVDRGTSEVRPRMFRVLSKITEVDHREFQGSYGQISWWARRHDKYPATNPVPPEVDELRLEVGLMRSWYDRVRAYKSN